MLFIDIYMKEERAIGLVVRKEPLVVGIHFSSLGCDLISKAAAKGIQLVEDHLFELQHSPLSILVRHAR